MPGHIILGNWRVTICRPLGLATSLYLKWGSSGQHCHVLLPSLDELLPSWNMIIATEVEAGEALSYAGVLQKEQTLYSLFIQL